MTIDPRRLRRIFLDLLAFNSPHGQERECARYCADVLADAGFLCQLDRAGNVLAQKAGPVTEAPRLFFSAHTDTVQPTAGLVVREEEGMFLTSGETILGADDKAGLAEILEGMLALSDSGAAHGDLQVVLTTGEEVGLLGAKALAPEVVAGSMGFVFDASGPVGTVITAAPTHDNLDAHLIGRAAHAGFAPEEGVSALEIACRAVSRMRLGRIDPETTANVGTLHGGTWNNIVAEHAHVTLEARSRNPATLDAQVAHMEACFREAAAELGGQADLLRHRDYSGYTWTLEDPLVRLAADAWRACVGREPGFRPTGGGSDANVFNAMGVPTVVLTCGYVDAHTVYERISMADLEQGALWAAHLALAAARPGR